MCFVFADFLCSVSQCAYYVCHNVFIRRLGFYFCLEQYLVGRCRPFFFKYCYYYGSLIVVRICLFILLFLFQFLVWLALLALSLLSIRCYVCVHMHVVILVAAVQNF